MTKKSKLTPRDVLTEKVTREEPCLIAMALGHTGECWGPIVFCHIKHSGMGGAYVPSYRNGWPGCWKHHSESHHGVKDFERRYTVSTRDEAERIGDIVDQLQEAA